MKKINMNTTNSRSFKEVCEKYIEYCRQRNLRDGTINHYRQSYTQFYKFFAPDTPIEEFDEEAYKRYVLHLKATLNNDVSINSYLRDYITTMHFLMDESYIPRYKMRAIKVDKINIETYSEQELKLLLKKPDIKKCSFNEYQCWVMTNFLFSTAVRERIKMFSLRFDTFIVLSFARPSK